MKDYEKRIKEYLEFGKFKIGDIIYFENEETRNIPYEITDIVPHTTDRGIFGAENTYLTYELKNLKTEAISNKKDTNWNTERLLITNIEQIERNNKTYRIFNDEILELREGSCSCCGNRRPVKGTDMCPECIIFAEECFYESRFPIIEENLSPEKAEIFKTWSFQKKKLLVNRCIKKGYMI